MTATVTNKITAIDTDKDFSQSANLFTKREWIMRYATPFKALMFMAGPMVIIQLVNSLYGIIDKQLALNFAIDSVLTMVYNQDSSGYITGTLHLNLAGTEPIKIVFDQIGIPGNWNENGILFAKQLINVSTQYSNTIITLLSALALLPAVGTAINWGQAMGRRDKARMDGILINGLLQAFVMGGVGILVLHFVAPYIITSQANMSYGGKDSSLIFLLSNSYTQMFIWGFPMLALSIFLSTLLRTEGKVWWVIGINIVAICLNILFGELFMDIAPASEKMQAAVYGSFFAWGFSIVAILIVIAFSKNTLLKIDLKQIKFKWADARLIWINGFSPFLANFIFAASNFVTTLLITVAHPGAQVHDVIMVDFHAIRGGVDTVIDTTYISPTLRVMSSVFPWLNILYAPIIGMMEGANANYSYCKGAQKRYRMVQIWRLHLLINIAWGVFCLIVIVGAGKPMMEAFDGPKELNWWFLAYISGIVFAAMTYSALSLFQGTGHALNAILIAVFRSLLFGIGFIIIGWVIAKKLSHDGTQDWTIFLFNGLSEIPAVIVTFILLSNLTKKTIKKYEINDVPDNFVSPSLQQAALNEVNMAYQVNLNHLDRWYEQAILRATNHHQPKKLAKLETKYEQQETKIATIRSKAIQKVEKKYMFDTMSLGQSPRDTAKKLLDRSQAKQLYALEHKKNGYNKKIKTKLEQEFKVKHEKLQQRMDQHDEYYVGILSGKIKLTPIKVFFSPIEPQPLWALDATKISF